MQWKTQVLQRLLKILALVNDKRSDSVLNINTVNTKNYYLSLYPSPPMSSMSLKELNAKAKKDVVEDYGIPSVLFSTWCEATTQEDQRKKHSKRIDDSVFPTLSVIVELLLTMKFNLDAKFLEHELSYFPLEMSSQFDNVLNLNICILILRIIALAQHCS